MRRYLQWKLSQQKRKHRRQPKLVDDPLIAEMIEHLTKKIENPGKATMSGFTIKLPPGVNLRVTSAGISNGTVFLEWEES